MSPPPMPEFLSRADVLYAVKAEDCEEFGATMEKSLRKRHKKRANVSFSTKVRPEQWIEAALSCGDGPFRIWLTPDIYVVLQRVEGTGTYTVKLTMRVMQIDTITRPADSLQGLAADVAALIYAQVKVLMRAGLEIKGP